jgi:hypothetical protein
MAAQRESSVEESSEWAGISESGDDDMDFEVWFLVDVARLLREELDSGCCSSRDDMVWDIVDGRANVVVA